MQRPSQINEKQEETKENNNVVTLKLVRTGLDEGGSDDRTWLEKLEVGSTFIAKSKDPTDFVGRLFFVHAHTEKAVVLLSPDIPGKLYAIPIPFCNRFSLFEDMGVIFSPEQQQEIMEGNDERDRLQSIAAGSSPELGGTPGK